MKHHYNPRNPELTRKALEFISRYGRDSFDTMINELLDQKKSPIKLGWIVEHIKTKKIIKRKKI
jgi:hypothetical protein